MPTVELLADGLGALVPPMPGRSPGLHVSDVVRDLCLGLGHFEERDLQPTRMALGCIMEHAIINKLQQVDPDNWMVPGELELGGLYGTPDITNCATRRKREIKLTWASSRHTTIGAAGPCPACKAAFCRKGWRYEVQLGAYVHMDGETEGELDVTYVNGDGTFMGDCVRRVWVIGWTPDELRANWRMLVNRAAQMRAAKGE